MKNKGKPVLSDFKAPKFPISEQDKYTINTLIESYALNVLLAAKSIYMMEAFVDKRWVPALIALNEASHQIETCKLDS